MMKKLSHRDILILIGILVAVVIALTTLVYKEGQSEAQTALPVPGKTSVVSSPSGVVKRFFEKLVVVVLPHNASASR